MHMHRHIRAHTPGGISSHTFAVAVVWTRVCVCVCVCVFVFVCARSLVKCASMLVNACAGHCEDWSVLVCANAPMGDYEEWFGLGFLSEESPENVVNDLDGCSFITSKNGYPFCSANKRPSCSVTSCNGIVCVAW